MSYEEKIMVAAGAASHEDEVKLETKHRTTVQIPSTVLGTCTTAAATAAKVVTLTDASGWELKQGATICIKFTNTNTAKNPTLNVNNTGAKSIYYNTSVITTGSLWTAGEANRFTSFMYDGTNWVWVGSNLDRNNAYSITQYTNTPKNLADFVTATAKGTLFCYFRFKDTNNVFGLGASEWIRGWIEYQNAAGSSPGVAGNGIMYAQENKFYKIFINGTTSYTLTKSEIKDTTYSAMSKSELTTGTATTSRVVRADYLKAGLLELANPVGTIIHSTTCDTMAKVVAAYGGTTWIQHSGYVLRGATSDVKANHTGNDGGADSVTVSSVASHNHTQNSHNHTQNAHKHAQGSQFYTGLGANNLSVVYAGQGWSTWGIGNINTDNATATNQAKTATNIANGANYTVNTLPKYKNVYIWERTA